MGRVGDDVGAAGALYGPRGGGAARGREGRAGERSQLRLRLGVNVTRKVLTRPVNTETSLDMYMTNNF